MTSENRMKLYVALAAPFPEDAIERTDGRLTGKGYSTTGIKYQFIVNRLNEVLGVGGFRVERKITMKEVATTKGRPAFEAACEMRLQLGEWVDGQFVPFAEAVGDGGHTAMALADAIKGAYTNSFKKTAAFFGVGRQAYEGSIDDDNVPAEASAPVARMPTRTASRAPVVPADALEGPHGVPTQEVPRAIAGRVTSAQLGKLRELVAEAGEDWATYRAAIRQRLGINIEYADRATASTLISERLDATGRRASGSGGNGYRRSP